MPATLTKAPASTAAHPWSARIAIVRAAGARSSDAERLLPRPAARGAALRRQDLAHLAAAGLAARPADPGVHRRPAGELRQPDALFLFAIFVTFALWSALGGWARSTASRPISTRRARASSRPESRTWMPRSRGSRDSSERRALADRHHGDNLGASGKRKARRIMASMAGDPRRRRKPPKPRPAR